MAVSGTRRWPADHEGADGPAPARVSALRRQKPRTSRGAAPNERAKHHRAAPTADNTKLSAPLAATSWRKVMWHRGLQYAENECSQGACKRRKFMITEGCTQSASTAGAGNVRDESAAASRHPLASAVMMACLLSDTRVASLAPTGRSPARAAGHHRRAGPLLQSVPDVAHDAPTTSRAGVTLVGAGPGDPDLLTVAALRLIEEPGALVIADRLISSEVLALVQGELRSRARRAAAPAGSEQIYQWVREER